TWTRPSKTLRRRPGDQYKSSSSNALLSAEADRNHYASTVKTFEELFAELTEKARTRPEGSGTVEQLDAGVHAIGKQVVEEAADVWMAGRYETTDEAAEEIA